MATTFSPGPVAPAPLGSLFTAQGLNAVHLGQPTRLRLRLAYADAGGAAAGGETGPVTLTLDVAAAGATPPAGPAPAVPGAAQPLTAAAGLSWHWWPAGEVLEVELPELTFGGEPGLRAVPLTVDYGGLEPAQLALPLLCLRPAAHAGLVPSTGRVHTTVRQARLAGPGEGEVGEGTVTLRISYPAPPATADAPADDAPAADGPVLYLLLSEGLLPGQDSLTTPGAAEAIELSVGENAAWQAIRVLDFAYPAWRLAPRPGQVPTAGPLDVELRHLRPRQSARGRAHLLVYGVEVPGAADGGQVVSLRWPGPALLTDVSATDSGDVSIVRFEASPAILTAPGPVQLSWQVRNADYVTISGLGEVPAEASGRTVVVDETTTFVLLAYGAGLGQLESRTLPVTVPGSRQVPHGTVLLWGGQLTDVPLGWALCDGQGGRPDLRDRFVLGAGGGAQPHTRGDADTHTHEVGANRLTGRTNEAGSHSHAMPAQWYDRKMKDGSYTAIDINGNTIKNYRTQDDGQHSHELSVTVPAFTTGPSSPANRPAWYALCYIIKL